MAWIGKFWKETGRVYAVSFSASSPFDGKPADRSAIAYKNGNVLVVQVQDYFYNAGELSRPYVTWSGSGRVEVVLDVNNQWGFVRSKCEHQRKVQMTFNIPSMQVSGVEVRNDDTGEMLIARIGGASLLGDIANAAGNVSGC